MPRVFRKPYGYCNVGVVIGWIIDGCLQLSVTEQAEQVKYRLFRNDN
jgi:hypothetical protein